MVHFLTWLIYPMTVFVLGMALAVVARCLRKPVAARWLFGLSLVWLFVWGTEGVPRKLGLWLEKPYPPLRMDQVPQADVIVLLGGGMGPARGTCLYPEMFTGADRVWHAARLYHAGKAPLIVPSGCAEQGSSVLLLKDLGVPASAIIVEGRSRNTIENGRFTRELIRTNGYTNALLVTSAFHMRRAELIFRTLGVRVFPVATDHEVTYGCQRHEDGSRGWYSELLVLRWLPSAALLDRGAWYLKEAVGYWGDTWRLKQAAKP